MIDVTKLLPDFGYGVPLTSNKGATAQQTPTAQQPTATAQPTPTGGTMSFQYPSQWGQANDVWSQMASGNYSNAGTDWLTKMMQSGGNAFDVSGFDKSYRPAMMDQFSNATKQMAEQAGVGGTRYGSGLQNSIANYGSQLQNQYSKDLWDRMFGAYESGQNRAAGAGSLLSQLGLNTQQAGAEGLLSLGQNYANLPLQVANSMTGIGGYLTGQQVDPWTQMMAQLIGPTGYAVPQSYTPNGFQSILGSLSQTLPSFLEGLGGSPGLPSIYPEGGFPLGRG